MFSFNVLTFFDEWNGGYHLILGCERLLHLYWLLSHVGEGDLHGELDGVQQLDDHVGDHFEARLPLSASWK